MVVIRKHTRHPDSELKKYMLLEIRLHVNLVACHFPQSLMRTRKWAAITCKVPQALVRTDGSLARQVMLLAFSLLQEDVDFQMRRYFYIRKDFFILDMSRDLCLDSHTNPMRHEYTSCRSSLALQLGHRAQSPASPKLSLEIKDIRKSYSLISQLDIHQS